MRDATRDASETTLAPPGPNFGQFSPDFAADIIKNYCPRYRVLVMGRRNAGKTTLLERMTHSSDGEVFIHDSVGNLIDPSSILQPSVERGHSHIEYEITYPSEPRYVFHDSKGMEAGSREELEKLRGFMAERRKKHSLKEKLHVIWCCLPVDNDRPLGKEEMSFFEQGTDGVPVIAIFTKFEWRITKAFDELRESGMGYLKAKKAALAKARADFDVLILQERQSRMKYPPAAYVYLQKLHEGGDCQELTMQTHTLVRHEVNERLFAKIQENNIYISFNIALVYVIACTKVHQDGVENLLKEWTALILSLFPHWNKDYFHEVEWRGWDSREGWAPLIKVADLQPVQEITSAVLSWLDITVERELQLLVFFVDVAMIAEGLFWIGGLTPWDYVSTITRRYRKSSQRDAVFKIAKKLHEEMNTPAYRHAAFGCEGPLGAPGLKSLATKYAPMLLEHRLPNVNCPAR